MTVETTNATIRCGNHKVHGRGVVATHPTKAVVKLCFSRPQGVPSLEEEEHEYYDDYDFPIHNAFCDSYEPHAGHVYNAINSETYRCPGITQADLDDMERRAKVECEHGLSADLCAGPMHYPSDRPVESAGRASVEVSAVQARLSALTGPSEFIPAVTPQPPFVSAPEPVILDGIYTIESAEGHRTLRLRTQEADAEFAPGQQVIEFLSGPDNERDYTGFGFIKGGQLKRWKRFATNAALLRDAETLLADPSGALKVAHCARCHRKLTVPSSINAMVGPECSKKMGL
jgi:hypothetical protein